MLGRSSLCVACSLALLSAPPQSIAKTPERADEPRIAAPHEGLVVLWGGGDPPNSLLSRFARAAAGRSAAIVGASNQNGDLARALENRARKQQFDISAIPADEKHLSQRIKPFAAVWVDVASLPRGSSPLDQVLLSADFKHKSPVPEIVETLQKHPGLVGLGVPRETALIATGRRWEVEGPGTVEFCLPPSVTRPSDRPLLLQHLRGDDEADFVALSRASIARLSATRFPPEEAAVPKVPHGSLLPCGGGDLPESIWRRFIELAGGTDAPIVVLPIATPNPDDPAPRGVDVLKRLGCRDITVLHQRHRTEIESPPFADALRRARGVWFAGGRQWKYVDAYEGTPAEQLFRDVLRRGGVIGGSSAGAAIQGQFMVRGDPLGNQNIIAEGYERGLGLLPGTAIDIHVAERGRLSEMFEVTRMYPQILGIALNEGVAAEIQGSVMTVLGKGQATIVETPTKPVTALSGGEQYDLAKRRKL